MNWRRLFHRDQTSAELKRELDAYLEIATEENIARGMDPQSARQAAHRKLGNATQIREEVHYMDTLTALDTILRHARVASRALRQNPTFTIAAILTLAVAIGANTAVFSVVNSVLLRPLPYPQSDRVVELHQDAPGAAGLNSLGIGLPLSASMYVTFTEKNQTFDSMGVWWLGTAVVTGVGEPDQVRVIHLSDGVLQALHVPPSAGRLLSAADQAPGAPDTVILSHGYWRSRFAANPTVIGSKIMLDKPHEVIGVMPPGFRIADTQADLFLPMHLDPKRQILAGFSLQGLGRLKPNITIQQANADLARLIPIWMHAWPSFDGGSSDPIAIKVYQEWRITPALRPLRDAVVGNIKSVLWVVMGTLSIVMLIACSNVANLLLVRAEARQHEIGVRIALGAGRLRIAAELLVEGALLAFCGAALGTALAYGGLRLLTTAGPDTLPRLQEISLDARALAFTLALAALAGIFFALIPASKYASRLSMTLRDGARGASASRERHRARNLLLVTQVALALILLIGSGLMIRTFVELRNVDPGFAAPNQVQTMRLAISPLAAQDKERVARIENDIVDKLAAIPGVTSVGFANTVPLDEAGPNWDGILIEQQTYRGGYRPPMRLFVDVSPGFFRSIGTPLIAGRDFNWTDLFNRRPVVLISENLARELWGSPASALGQKIHTADPAPWFEIVGVAKDIRSSSIHEPAPPTVYWPAFGIHAYSASAIKAVRSPVFTIRTSRAGTQGLADELRRAVWSVNPSLPIAEVQTLQDISDKSMARTSFTLVMLAIAGAMALVLGTIGIYGVIAYSVAQRRREVGIRMALGARPESVRRMFLQQGLLLSGAGILFGLAGAAGLTGVLSSLLFGVQPLDPFTFAATPLVLLIVALTACYIPARRAAAIDPAQTLRSE